MIKNSPTTLADQLKEPNTSEWKGVKEPFGRRDIDKRLVHY